MVSDACHVVLEREERGELHLRARDELQGGLRGDAERPLVAGEQLLERQPGRGLAQLAAASLADLHDLAGRQDDLHRDDEVTRVAEARPEQRPSARPDAPADERARIGRRVVGIEDAVWSQLLVELEHVDARPDRDRAVHEVELVDAVDQLDVDADAAAQRHRSVGQAGAAARGTTGIRIRLVSLTISETSCAESAARRHRAGGWPSVHGDGAGTRVRFTRELMLGGARHRR